MLAGAVRRRRRRLSVPRRRRLIASNTCCGGGGACPNPGGGGGGPAIPGGGGGGACPNPGGGSCCPYPVPAEAAAPVRTRRRGGACFSIHSCSGAYSRTQEAAAVPVRSRGAAFPSVPGWRRRRRLSVPGRRRCLSVPGRGRRRRLSEPGLAVLPDPSTRRWRCEHEAAAVPVHTEGGGGGGACPNRRRKLRPHPVPGWRRRPVGNAGNKRRNGCGHPSPSSSRLAGVLLTGRPSTPTVIGGYCPHRRLSKGPRAIRHLRVPCRGW